MSVHLMIEPLDGFLTTINYKYVSSDFTLYVKV